MQLLLSALLLGANSPANSHESPVELRQFRAARPQMLRSLVGPPGICIARDDTDHPVFHGCVDWHSAVHGTWSLVAVGLALHDDQLIDRAKAILAPTGLAAERMFLRQNPEFEMPYGRAWFLRLAVDFEHATGDPRLRDISGDVATSLAEYLFSRPLNPSSRSYQSDTWALINLHYYAAWHKDAQLLRRIEQAVRRYYAAVQGTCPELEAEATATDFMPVCTNWAWLVSTSMQAAEFRQWVATFLPPTAAALSPVTQPSTPHHHGIDFARAWGLWWAYSVSGDPRYLDLYLAHVTTAFEHPTWWSGDYRTVSHWVAQFGILAIYLSYQDLP